jgi:signal transduction histidine kinase
MKIASRIRLMACGLVIGTALSVASVEYWSYRSLVAGQQQESLARQVESEALRLESALADLRSDVGLVAGLPSIHAYVEAHARGDKVAEELWNERSAAVFIQMLRTHPHYTKAAFIGAEDGGREIVRVNGGENGPSRVPESALQRKSERPYFQQAVGLPLGKVYVSPVTLNREGDEIEVPHRAILRVALPIHTRTGESFGIVIINVDFVAFLEDLFPSQVGRYTYYLTNDAGDFLVHPDPTRSFGFELGTRYRVQDEFPELASDFDSNLVTFSVRGSDRGLGVGRLISFRKIFPDPAHPLALGIAASYDDVTDQTLQVGWGALALTGGLLLIAGAAAWFVASLVTAPVARITAVVRDFGRGGAATALPTERTDEIGVLARVFDQAMQTVRERESQILATSLKLQEANADLEHFAHIASHDLREPARRVAGLADVVLLKEADRISPEGGDLLRRMRQAAIKMLDQITDFRALTKIGHGALLREETDLVALVRSVLDERAGEIDARGVRVQVGPLPRLDVYGNLVQLLYANLVDNALKHANLDAFTLGFTVEETTQGCVLGVRNTGSEIRAEDLKRIFAPFTRLQLRTDGSGLGLSICKRIVERHAGNIWAESGTGYVHIKFTLGGRRHDGIRGDNESPRDQL